jgi:hypothetical protein
MCLVLSCFKDYLFFYTFIPIRYISNILKNLQINLQLQIKMSVERPHRSYKKIWEKDHPWLTMKMDGHKGNYF